jgi:signal transduction histidine kinase
VQEDNLRFLTYINAAVFSGVAWAAWQLHRRLRTEPSKWLNITFTTLAAIVVAGVFLPPSDERDTTLLMVVSDVIIVVLMLFPYALLRFTAGFVPISRRLRMVALAALIGISVFTFAVPTLPEGEAARPLWAVLYLVYFAVYWTALSMWVALRLWRGGRGQPGVAKRRMRLLATGTVLLNVALLLAAAVSSSGGDTREPVIRITTTVLAWFSAGAFLLGFSPPSGLRHAWRQDDERRLRRAEASLMTATSEEQVAQVIVPHIAELLGGHGAALLDRGGDALAAIGFTAEQIAALPDPTQETIERGRLILPLQLGALVVEASPFAPFFGEEELELLRALGAFVDLALSRIHLYAQQHETQLELERTNEELVALVYGISHDLRSPIVTVIGYLELLASDASGQFDDESRHYLDRISVSARYMDSLIRDLLELSRIGRTQTETESVDLGSIVADIAAELRRTHPAATFVVPDLPTVQMNPVRARQLFTNLMENAVRHGGREDITVTVSADASGGDTVVSVSDDGAGIDEAYRERVFGIFERLDSEVASQGAGTGIGLAMCRKIVEQLGGSIWIHPAAAGTTFKISFPAVPAQRSARSMEVPTR